MLYRHGMHKTRFYSIWRNIRSRVSGNHSYYKKGDILLHWESFDDFKRDMYPAYLRHVKKHGEADTTIDRIDGTKGYSKENCRWATRRAQTRNRRSNKFLTYKGRTQTIADWAEEFGINKSTFYYRVVRYGMSIEKAMIPLSYGQKRGGFSGKVRKVA